MTVDRCAELVAKVTGASRIGRSRHIQSVWSGYGDVLRYDLDGAQRRSVVVKHIRPGKGRGRSHDRKLRSYEVEQSWYEGWAGRCDDACRLAQCLHVERQKGEWIFIFEDLDEAGFSGRREIVAGRRMDSCLRWLAAFHARFLGERPKGLWKTGTYWHLGTRPDEHRAMSRGPLRDAAAAIDRRLASARFKTLVHGDAKPANFCFSADGSAVAAVDFQYVGGGCGIKDVAYLLAGEDQGTVRRGLKLYFAALGKALGAGRERDAVLTEWRNLFPWAWADFHRFLAGWAPDWRYSAHELARTGQVIDQVGSE